MHRRSFLTAVAGAALARVVRSADPPKDVRITRAVGFDVPLRRSKIAGRNARLDVHGDRSTDRMVRLYTNAGVEAVGNCRADEKAVRELVGKDPFAYYRQDERRMTGSLGPGTMPLWDLLGKLVRKPVSELLGGAGPERVPVYDGSIYFADLLPQYADRWRDRFAQADRNHDGKLSQGEANDYFVSQIFSGADQNHDGQVTWDEWNVPGSGRSKTRFDAADTNKDGSVSLTEAQAYGQKKGVFNKEFAEADTNHDGNVTREEAQAYYASKEGPAN